MAGEKKKKIILITHIISVLVEDVIVRKFKTPPDKLSNFYFFKSS